MKPIIATVRYKGTNDTAKGRTTTVKLTGADEDGNKVKVTLFLADESSAEQFAVKSDHSLLILPDGNADGSFKLSESASPVTIERCKDAEPTT